MDKNEVIKKLEFKLELYRELRDEYSNNNEIFSYWHYVGKFQAIEDALALIRDMEG